MARASESPLARIHALWTLDGIGELDWESVRTLSRFFRRDGSRYCDSAERAVFGFTPNREAVLLRLLSLTDDERPPVRLQLLLTLGEIRGNEDAERSMADIISLHPSPVFRTAIVSGLQDRELEFIERLVQHQAWVDDKEKEGKVLETLATAVVNEAKPERIFRLLNLISAEQSGQTWRSDSLISGILNSDLSRERWPEPILLAQAPKLLIDPSKLDAKSLKLLRIITWPGDTTKRVAAPVITPLTAEQERAFALGESVYHATCNSCHKSNGEGTGCPSSAACGFRVGEW